jgi:putrescine importer
MSEPATLGSVKSADAVPRLHRVLKLWDLIFYGIILVMPIGPAVLFGICQKLSEGQMVTTILIAMLAMMLTAFSYGRMAALYPSAGSAYTYVARALNPHLGFLTGWAMFLDYLLAPLINTIYGALALQRLVAPLFPHLPAKLSFALLAALFVGTMTFLNLRGIRSTARTNLLLLIVMCGAMTVFMVLAIRYLYHLQGWQGVFSLQPFYNPSTFRFRTIATGTSFAALTYIGFDGVTTLAEDVENPTRNVLRATVVVCLFTGLFGGLQAYLAQRVWPDWHSFPNLETAFMDVCQRVGGVSLFKVMAGILILACLGTGLGGQVGAARLLFGMGRDNVLPRRFFAFLDPKRNNPSRNIWTVGILAYAGALLISYETGGELVNFGAFLAFMGVNLAALRSFYFQGKSGRRRRLLSDALVPGLGFLFCLAIWIGLLTPAKIVGGVWFLLGFTYEIIQTRGFRRKPAMIDFSET